MDHSTAIHGPVGHTIARHPLTPTNRLKAFLSKRMHEKDAHRHFHGLQESQLANSLAFFPSTQMVCVARRAGAVSVFSDRRLAERKNHLATKSERELLASK